MKIAGNMFLKAAALSAAAVLLSVMPVSAKTICNGGGWCYNTSGKRIHYSQQPAVQDGYAPDRWPHRHWHHHYD
jgi:hypothetical protein